MSATAVHFSMAATRAAMLLLVTISEQTSRDPSLNRFVIRMICSARDFLSDFIQAWPRNSSLRMAKKI
uniref:Putative secreted protein n=1 Tax=Anopheles darlingi TaxID=43151 RepID=A0A2M4DD05_ANODA